MKLSINTLQITVLAVIVAFWPSWMDQVQAGPGEWTNFGPDGGWVAAVATSDAMPNRIYAGGAGGLFRSDDEGLNWQRISVGLPYQFISSMAVDPVDADIIYLQSADRLFKSTDAGVSWSEPSPGFDESRGAILSWDINPADTQEISIATFDGGLLRSADGGLNWTPLDGGFFESAQGMVILPDNRNVIIAAGVESGGSTSMLYRSSDGGVSWTAAALTPGFGFTNLSSMAAAPGGRVLATLDGFALYASSDGGANFTQVTPSPHPGARLAAISPGDSDRWFLGGDAGLVVTDDAGSTWDSISSGMGPPQAGGYTAGTNAFALKPGDSDVLLVGSRHAGFFRSADAGATWERRNSGLRSTNIRALAIHPVNSNIVYAGYGDAFSPAADNLWVSFDSGGSWSLNADGLNSGGVRALAVDSNTAANPFTTHIYSGGSIRFLTDIDLGDSSLNSGVFKSTNGAGIWTESGNGIPVGDPIFGPFFAPTIRSVVLDPASGAGGGALQTVYVAGSGLIQYEDDGSGTMVPSVFAHRIHKSTDAGANWSPAGSGLPVPAWDDVNNGVWTVQVVPLVINPVNPSVLYAGTIVSSPVLQQAGVTPDVDNGVFRSTDGGATWTPASNGLPRFDDTDPASSHVSVLALAISHSNPSRLYAAANHGFIPYHPSVIYRSDDGGDNWVEFNNGIPADIDIRWLLVDPDDPDVAYAAGGGSPDNPGAVYRTEDGGANWVSYSIGLPADSVTSLAIDKSGANPVLYAGGRGGVFHFEQVPDEDLDGVPDAPEQGAPSGGDGNTDGVPDHLQSEVASLLSPGGGARGTDSYITVELVEKGGSQCTRLMNVHTLAENTFPVDSGFEYPYGLVRFEIPDCPGSTVRIVFHDNTGASFGEDWQFRIYAPDIPGDISTIRWQNFSAHASPEDNIWALELTDGQLGDLRPANGRILFQGGPAIIRDNAVFRDRFESN